MSKTGLESTNSVDCLVEGIWEIVGEGESNHFLNSLMKAVNGNEPDEILSLKGIMIRTGQAGFNYWLSANYSHLGWHKADFRFQPTLKKISTGLVDICAKFSQDFGVTLLYEQEADHWLIHIFDNESKKSKLPSYLCGYLWGFLQEFTRWADVSRYHPIHEIQCRFMNQGHCILQIGKATIE